MDGRDRECVVMREVSFRFATFRVSVCVFFTLYYMVTSNKCKGKVGRDKFCGAIKRKNGWKLFSEVLLFLFMRIFSHAGLHGLRVQGAKSIYGLYKL